MFRTVVAGDLVDGSHRPFIHPSRRQNLKLKDPPRGRVTINRRDVDKEPDKEKIKLCRNYLIYMGNY